MELDEETKQICLNLIDLINQINFNSLDEKIQKLNSMSQNMKAKGKNS